MQVISGPAWGILEAAAVFETQLALPQIPFGRRRATQMANKRLNINDIIYLHLLVFCKVLTYCYGA